MIFQVCLDAIEQRALQAAGSRLCKQTSSEVKSLAAVFARRAKETLSQQEYEQLLDFLTGSQTRLPDVTELETQIGTAVQQFHLEEIAVSHQGSDRLGCPGGFVGADVGLVLHLQTKDLHWNKFFDSDDDNATMKLLCEKGVTADVGFGMDWHWRGETKQELRERTHCPFKKSRQELRQIHDDFSWRILETVPARFLVTGSACARDGIRQRLPSARRLELANLDFDLDFRPTGLRRITLHLPHPTAGFYAGLDEREKIGNHLDSGWNFMLWLVGKDCSPDTFRKEYSQIQNNMYHGHAMLRESYGYRSKEIATKRKLQATEYSSAYLRWAEHRLSCPAVSIINTGRSLAEAVLAPVNKKQKTTHLQNMEQKRRRNAEELARKPAVLESIHGKPIHIVPHGDVKINRQGLQKPLRFRLSGAVATKILNHNGTPLANLTLDAVRIVVDDIICYSRPYQQLMQSLSWGEEWTEQTEYEVHLLSGSLPPTEITKSINLNDSPTPGRLLYRNKYVLHGKHCLFRGVRFNVTNAINGFIFLRVELLDEGYTHPNVMCDAIPAGDPGRRFGIWVSYNTEEGIIEDWVRVRGSSNVAKINTLVDTEDGKTRDWIAQQPRRYLKSFEGKAHWYSPVERN